MTQLPPVPTGNTSPFPIEEPPHRPPVDGHFDDAHEDGAEDRFSLTGLLDDIGIDARTAIGIGAAVGIGALAGISALLFSAGRRRAAAPSRRKPAASASRARKTGGARSGRTGTAAKKPARSTRRKADA